MKSLASGLVLAILLPALTHADEPAKAQFQTVKLQTLAKTGAQYDWSKTEFIEALKGGDGWEVLATSDSAILFRKGKDGPKWEYKSVKIKNSPFSITGMKDTDAFGLILDRMASDGYMPCAASGIGEHTLFKRVKDAKPLKTEYQTLLLADVVKSKAAPAERFKEKEFIEALNKQGGDGWEVAVCNHTAVVLQKGLAKWEYKTVKITKSPADPEHRLRQGRRGSRLHVDRGGAGRQGLEALCLRLDGAGNLAQAGTEEGQEGVTSGRKVPRPGAGPLATTSGERAMPLHSSMIGGVQVAGFRYVVYGPKRGAVSTHRTKRAAFRSLAEDSRERMRLNSPSDAQVYFWACGREGVGTGGRRVRR